jgi:hypothetical protein
MSVHSRRRHSDSSERTCAGLRCAQIDGYFVASSVSQLWRGCDGVRAAYLVEDDAFTTAGKPTRCDVSVVRRLGVRLTSRRVAVPP